MYCNVSHQVSSHNISPCSHVNMTIVDVTAM